MLVTIIERFANSPEETFIKLSNAINRFIIENPQIKVININNTFNELSNENEKYLTADLIA
jgi:hypothetical protein